MWIAALSMILMEAPPSAADRRRFIAASEAAQRAECPRALKLLRSELAPGGGDQLPEELRAGIFTLGMICEAQANNLDRVYALADRATRANTTEPLAWMLRIERELAERRFEDVTITLETLAQGRGDVLNRIESKHLGPVVAGLLAAKQGALRRRVLKVLAESYSPADEIAGSDAYRLMYAQTLAAAGELAGTPGLVRGITDPGLLRRVMVDPALRHTLPTNFDIREATERRLTDRRLYIAGHADRLAPILEATTLLRMLGRPQEALDLLQASEARLDGDSFADIADLKVWFWDSRSRSLEQLGRIDEAAHSLETAIASGEGGGKNVSHIINLMQLLADNGREKAALAVPAAHNGMGSTTPYGELQLRRARGCANAGIDRAALAADVTYAREYRQVDPTVLTDLLLCAGELDGAARELIAQLAAPDLRVEVLLRASRYAQPPVPVLPSTREVALRSVLARADVQAALAAAGGIRSFNVQRVRY